jgi:hypothetical protein
MNLRACVMWLALAVCTAARAAVPTPSVTLPPAGTHGFPFLTSSINLAAFGYTEQEFLISGTAHTFVNSGPLGNNGVWNVTPGEAAPYVTRILVRKPKDAAHFNGTVLVEWLNVSGGVDAEPEWDFEHVELLRAGYAWVGVTAQFAGASFLSLFDSTRYLSIFHPGDSWSYDIYSQAGEAVLHGNPKPLGSLTPFIHSLVAEGESQSAFRMFTYYNAVQPLTRLYQGFLIHSTGSGAALSQSFAGTVLTSTATVPPPPGVPATPDIPVPATAFIRGDLPQPVMFFNTETDISVLGAGFSVHNQPDSNTFRMWEVAGTTHADAYLLQFAGLDAEASGLAVPPFNCGDPPINNGPETFAVRAALHSLNIWIRAPRLRPPTGARLSVQILTSPQPAAVINRDPKTGNAIGGIRLPQVTVPVETLSGIRPPAAVVGNPNCILFGAADPWDGDTDAWDGQAGLDPSPTPEPSLSALYRTKFDYLVRYELATLQSTLEGFLLPLDAGEVISVAKASSVPDGAASNAAIVPNP